MVAAGRRRFSKRVLGIVAIAALCGGSLTLSQADASTPSEGTITATSPTTSWSGGPFVTPNVTGNVSDQPDCTAPSSCDDFTLHVQTPAGYGQDHQLQVKVHWANTSADFDLYLLDQHGKLLSSAASSADPETILVPPTTGTYTVRVVPFAPLGQSYNATASLVAIPSNPPPGSGTPPTFSNTKAPSSFADANNAGEPSIGTSFKNGDTFYEAGLSTYRVTWSAGHATWADVSANAANGCPQGSTTSLDPILYTDHTTGRTFESQLTGFDSFTCYTDDNGQTWSVSQGGGIPSGVDHQTIGGGAFAPNDPTGLPHTYPHAVYYCSQDLVNAFCATSRDGGTTFGPGVPTYALSGDGSCGGLHGHIKVAPDGTAYLPNKSCGATQAVVVSKDDGTSWTVRPVPGATPGDSDPSVGVGANGTVYFGYVGADGKPGIAVSTNKGATWQHLQTVGTEFSVKNAVFPTVVAGDDNRASFAYIGTPTGGNYQDPSFKGNWHLYVDTTYDGGQHWVTSNATGSDPVQRGPICTAGTTCGSDRNLLDFIDVTVSKQGRIEAAYADGCIGSCVTGGANNHDAYASIARQSGGLGLFSQFDPNVPNLTLSRLDVTKGSTMFTAKFTVTNTGHRAINAVGSAIYDNGTKVRSTATLDWAVGASRTFTLSWTPTSVSKHTVTVVADPTNKVAESNERDNKGTQVVYR